MVADGWFLEGGGELGSRMRTHDWTSTPLGPPAHWPRSLKTAVRIMLTSSQPFWIGWGPELTYLYNDAYKSIIGGKHPRALGRPFKEVWREIWDVVGPMADTVMHRDQGIYVEAQLLIMERHGYPEETYYTFSYSPVADDEGRPGGLICANTDDTRRVIGERQLATLRELAERCAPARSWREACSLAMQALAVNPRDLPFALVYVDGVLADACGIEPARAALPFEKVLGEVGAVALDASFGELPRGPWDRAPRQVAVIPMRVAGPAGRSGVLVAGLNPFRRFDADFQGFLDLVARQIAAAMANAQAYEDERLRAEALAELDAAKTTFFSNVSHEFRTPLTLMLGPLEDLVTRGPHEVSADARALLEVVQRNGQRMLKLVNALLDFARIEADRAQALYEPTDLAVLTADLASTFRAACERAGLRLEVDCPPLGEPAWVDREMWEKIVLNLVSNAFKFTLEGRIHVQLRGDGPSFELRVSDTGTGIPSAELPRMFERFHRVQGARGRSHEGSGIGLALVSELVKLHGGAIGVESRPGEGTQLRVSIPRGSAHLPAERIRPHGAAETAPSQLRAGAYLDEALSWLPRAHPSAPRAGAGPRVLLADDNTDLREYARRLLDSDYDVEAVNDGEAALAAARARRPDLVISDVMMPRLDGFGLVRALRADPALCTVPVILLSARAGEEARLEGIGRGADDYLVKPFSARELLVRAAALLKTTEIRREAEAALLEEARTLETLNRVGRSISSDLDLHRTLQAVTDAATEVSGAQFGAFFYNETNDAGENYLLYTLSGAPREAFEKFGTPRITAVFAPTFAGEGPVRLDDVTRDPRYGKNAPLHGMPEGHLPVRSYLAVPVISRTGEVIGGLFFGHGEPGAFSERSERLALSIAAQAAVAIDNARLHEQRLALIDQLRDADRAKDEFLATLSHELRNPLAPLRNALHVLQRAGQGSIQPIHEMMERQVNHLVRLVDDLMEMSRIARGSFELRREAVDLQTVLRNAIETSEPLIAAASHRLDVRLPELAIPLYADAVRLAQVFANLLNNAARYTPPGGAISVAARREGNEAVVEVADTGEGIEAEELARLFQMFRQGNRTSRLSQGGLGIGLALARRLLQMHGGSVQASSDGRGKGSTFTVRLPVAARAEPAPAGGTRSSEPVAPRRVLVVDDNADAANSLGMLLQFLGADVQVAHDGQGALESFESYRPDLVLLDIGMPGMDGYQVARAIRALPRGDGVSLVALTGWGQEEDRRLTREAGFDHHLVKPADVGALEALLASLTPGAGET